MTRDESLKLSIVPTVGWGPVRLGATKAEVRELLLQIKDIEIEERSSDKYILISDNPYYEFQFVADQPERLVQIIVGDGPMIVDGTELLGLPIDEVLLVLGVRSFNDTLWSVEASDQDYENGIPEADTQRITHCETLDKLRWGTLWIRSMGLGLGMNNGHVGDVSIRLPQDVPVVGCGPLDEDTLLLATDPQLQELINAEVAKYREQSASNHSALPPIRTATKIVLTFLALVLVVVPIYIMVRNYQRWSSATQVTGTIVAVEPETFPDFLDLEYPLPNSDVGTARIQATYAATRDVGGEVELLYVASDPTRVVTLSQRYDQVLDGHSPFLLLTSIPAGIFLFSLAFPELTWSRRRSYVR